MLNKILHIAKTHRRRLIGTFSLVALENILFLLYPLVGSFAVNAVIAGQLLQALSYGLMVLLVWSIGSARRAVDTRAFVKIYADLVVPLIINQRTTDSTSTTTARVALSRQFVNFFEHYLPVFLMAFFSIIGSVVMLLIIEFWSGVTAATLLIIFILLLPRYSKANDRLYLKLNNRLEKEVDVIERINARELFRHYDFVSNLRIRISNREAVSYLVIGVAMSVLFSVTFTLFITKGYGNAGHIYAVITYLWNFAMSIDDIPKLMEQYSELKDIGKRINIGENEQNDKV
ncbi:MAG: ABC transporter six-transmembrane domain-containing protein [Capnocytophaga sp.]|nr:ABC transporter six-transmembrane domain-containing protein [Capnocytophaga sp.]